MTKILITGDFCPLNRIEKLILKESFSQIYNDFYPLIQDSDIAITNLECPLIAEGKKTKKTGPNLKAPLKTIDALKYCNFNILTLANNHIMDFGPEGLDSTILACKTSGIDYVGSGSNIDDARKPLFKDINGLRIAIINFCENEWSTTENDIPGANPLNPIANYYDIIEAKKNSDHVIVIVHGGHEYYHLPSPRMQETYRFFIDAGASVVVGHHTHCFSGYEIYKDSPIFYSLGNFIFDSGNVDKLSSWNKGFALQLQLSKQTLSFSIFPYIQCHENPGLRRLNNNENEIFNYELANLNQIIENSKILKEYFDKHCQKLDKSYSLYLEPYSSKIASKLYFKNFLPSFLTERKKNLILNLIRCEAHRDILIKIFSRT